MYRNAILLWQVGLRCVTRVADTWSLNLLALEARPLESFVVTAGIFSFRTLGVFDRRVRFSPCTISAFFRYDVGVDISPTSWLVTCVKNQGGCPSKYVGYGLSTSSYGSTVFDQSCRDMCGRYYSECVGMLSLYLLLYLCSL